MAGQFFTLNQPTTFGEDYNSGVDARGKTIAANNAADELRRKKALNDAFSSSLVTETQYDDKGNVAARPGDLNTTEFLKKGTAEGLSMDQLASHADYYQKQREQQVATQKANQNLRMYGADPTAQGRAGAQRGNSLTDEQLYDQFLQQKNGASSGATSQDAATYGGTSGGLTLDTVQKSIMPTAPGADPFDLAPGESVVNGKVVTAPTAAPTTTGTASAGGTGAEDGTVHITAGRNDSKGVYVPTIPTDFDTNPADRYVAPAKLPDNRTSSQAVEDSFDASKSAFNTGAADAGGTALDYNSFSLTAKAWVDQLLAKTGYEGQAGLDKMRETARSQVAAPAIALDKNGDMDPIGTTNNVKKYKAELAAADAKFVDSIREGATKAINEDLAQQGNRREAQARSEAHTGFKQGQTPGTGLEKYGIKGYSATEAPKLQATLAQWDLMKKQQQSVANLVKHADKLSQDELATATKQTIMLAGSAEGASNEKQEAALLSGLRRNPGWAESLRSTTGKPLKERLDMLLTTPMTSQSNKQYTKLLHTYITDIVDQGAARGTLETAARLGGGKFTDPDALSHSTLGDKLGAKGSQGNPVPEGEEPAVGQYYLYKGVLHRRNK